VGPFSPRRRHRPSLPHTACSQFVPSQSNKSRSRGHKDNGGTAELIVKEEGQEYAQIVRMLGNNRCEGSCFDGTTRILEIRGGIRNKIWINPGDIVLIGLRDFQDKKADIISKYTPDEARKLKQRGELPDNSELSKNDAAEDDLPFDFAEL